MRRVFIEHITNYLYANNISYHSNQIMLYPWNDACQQVNNQSLKITSNPKISIHTDFFGNKIGTFNITEPHNSLFISSLIEVTTKPKIIPEINTAPPLQWKQIETLRSNLSFFEFFSPSETYSNSEILSIVPKKYREIPPLKFCISLSGYIYKNFVYKQGVTSINTPLSKVWELKAGVCQDFTNVLLHMYRFFGIPSRYVSGYICPTAHSNFRGIGATHAWVEVFLPELGWVGLDPTNNCITNENYVKLAIGRHYRDCSPVKGVYSGDAINQLDVRVSINDKNQFNPVKKVVLKPNELEKKETQLPVNSYALHQEILMQQQQQQQ